MLISNYFERGLDQALHSPHSLATRGQSRGRGLVTSGSERRSRFLGRVAVAYVQGSPKGGGALGSLMVTSTRLRPVPPFDREARVSWGQRNTSTDHRLHVAAGAERLPIVGCQP